MPIQKVYREGYRITVEEHGMRIEAVDYHAGPLFLDSSSLAELGLSLRGIVHQATTGTSTMPPGDEDEETPTRLKRSLESLWEAANDRQQPTLDLDLPDPSLFTVSDLMDDWEEDRGYLIPIWWPRQNTEETEAPAFQRALSFERRMLTLLDSTPKARRGSNGTFKRRSVLSVLAQLRLSLEDSGTLTQALL